MCLAKQRERERYQTDVRLKSDGWTEIVILFVYPHVDQSLSYHHVDVKGRRQYRITAVSVIIRR